MRRIASLWLAVLLVAVGGSAEAAPRDKAAQGKIKEAIEVHFLNTDFDAAEGLLLGTIRACEDKCSPDVLARAWMYVGVVRGTGRNDLGGAKEAFTQALASDPNVALDNDIANDDVKLAFKKLKGGGGEAAPPTPTPSAAPAGALKCEPTPSEVETRRPFPLQCEAETDLTAAKLYYKAFGTSWTSVRMEAHDGTFRGTVPCKALGNTGSLKYYVEGLDGDEVVAGFGTKDDPRSADITSETTADPPAFPGEEPPKRCSIEDMPTDAPKAEGGDCGAWGAPCGTDDCCADALACVKGNCESKQCESDSDCSTGEECNEGRCEDPNAGGGGAGAKNWITLQFGMDIASISADKACASASREEHVACFYGGGETYPGEPNPNAAGKINGGFAPSTMRVMASYERLFGPIGAELRLGFAFNGGPTPDGGTAFLPFHAELRGKWWIRGTKAFEKPGVRPWLHLGGGLAQVDAQVSVQVADCGVVDDPARRQACLDAPDVNGAYENEGKRATLTAVKQLGQSFVTVGGGMMYAIGKNHGPLLNLNFMIPFPSTGFVIEPSLGYGVGF